mmetsp:Transcript_114490/g.369964  ORF Transcript_114490/g.369964 Transcript_114490/m.369964 type:complete len:285 (+) Transcript_114490:420-1274(+)
MHNAVFLAELLKRTTEVYVRRREDRGTEVAQLAAQALCTLCHRGQGFPRAEESLPELCRGVHGSKRLFQVQQSGLQVESGCCCLSPAMITGAHEPAIKCQLRALVEVLHTIPESDVVVQNLRSLALQVVDAGLGDADEAQCRVALPVGCRMPEARQHVTADVLSDEHELGKRGCSLLLPALELCTRCRQSQSDLGISAVQRAQRGLHQLLDSGGHARQVHQQAGCSQGVRRARGGLTRCGVSPAIPRMRFGPSGAIMGAGTLSRALTGATLGGVHPWGSNTPWP